jgi:hypothetical protein
VVLASVVGVHTSSFLLAMSGPLVGSALGPNMDTDELTIDLLLPLIDGLRNALAEVNDRVNGLSAANEVILEVLLSSNPVAKDNLVVALSQILSHSDRVQNHYCLEAFQRTLTNLQHPSRTTPEGRRSWLHLVSPDEDA